MKNQLFKSLIISGLMLGIVAACGGDPNIESAKLNLRNNDFQGVIAAAERALETNPENPDAYYFLGAAHLEIADEKHVSERVPDYTTGRKHLLKAHELYTQQGVRSNEAEAVIPILEQRWATSYITAIENVSFEGGNDPDTLQYAVYRLNNAIALAPDSLINYEALAEIYFLKDDVNNAIKYMRTALDMATEPNPQYYERITYFYIIAEQPEESLELLLEARQRFPDEIFFIQEIANVYFQKGEIDKAIEVLEDLIEMDPENAQYRLVYGSQIYQEYLNMNEEVNQLQDEIFELNREFSTEARKSNPDMRKIDAIDEQIKQKRERIIAIDEVRFNIADRAEEQLMIAYELDSDDPNTTYTLGAINENRALAYVGQRNLTDDLNEVNRLDALAKQYFEKALPFYERTAELEDNEQNWMKLFQLYTRLNMTEKAEEALERAGL